MTEASYPDISKANDSPLGLILMSSDGENLSGLRFYDDKVSTTGLLSSTSSTKKIQEKTLNVFRETIRWLDIYFSGKEPNFSPPLTIRGTSFQKAVWKATATIPFGQTATYSEIAAIIAKQRGLTAMSSQAVGNALARNPIALIIPCHRVIAKNGSLSGYAGGLNRKKFLLSLEKNR
ncbi:MAG: methylated-DNA--[protein]-cysteine S-methyltransferase [Candidatus Riflebacteria bacterium]|nr:methylated-DNA--[protein]-cysteine S-methyltransferase [Candidatus Riflebacteria bacterium]